MKHSQAVDQLRAVLCDPEGNVVILGKDEDRAVIQQALDVLSVDPTKTLLLQLFKGLNLQRTTTAGRQLVDCMTEACGGDQARGHILSLFTEYTNDLADLALVYGIQVQSNYFCFECTPRPLSDLFDTKPQG